MKKLLRCAIYIRVSTWEQAVHGKSLQAQKEFLEGYAKQHEMKVVGVYADEGQTARKELKKRKAIHALLDQVKLDKIDIILFWRMDRWFRNVSDFYKVQDVLDAHNVRWIDVGEPNINMETRDGRLSLNLALAIGQNEVDTTSERIKFTVDNTITNGGMVWGKENLPFGYAIDIVDGKKKMVKDAETESIVEDVYRFFSTYQSKKQTVLYIRDTYDIPFSYSTLRTMLSSEFYIGKYRNNVNYCPAYLTPEQWSNIQAISQKNIKRPRTGRIYLFSGLILCPVCGCKLAGACSSSVINRKTKETRRYNYYRCNKALLNNLCTNKHSTSQNLIETYLLEHIQEEYNKFQARCIVKSAEGKNSMKKKGRTPEKIKEELERLNILFQKGRISYDYYETEYNRLEKELQSANIIPLPEAKKDSSYLEQLFSDDFRSLYNSLSEENRQAFWRNTIKAIHLTADYQVDHVDFL